MKRMIIILLLLSSLVVIVQAKNKTGLDLRGLKGQVKSCERTVGTEDYKMLMTFDAYGNEIGYKAYNYDSEKKDYVVSFSRTSKTDANHNVNQCVQTGYDGSTTATFKYNEQNLLIEENLSDGEITKYTYDAKGNQTEKLIFSADSKTPAKTVYEYDEKDQNIECDQYNCDGEEEWKNYYAYDEKGNQVGFMRKAHMLDYDEDTDEEFTSEEITLIRTSVYNEQGFLISEITESIDSIIGSSQKTFTYTFDKMGNWTKKNILVEGEEPTFETQVIEYY